MRGWNKIKSRFNGSAKEPTWKEARNNFFKAIHRQDTERLSLIAAQYPEALKWENEKGSPLFISMNANKFKSFCHLALLGADIHQSDLLSVAAKKGKTRYVEFLLEQGATANTTAEIYARVYKHFEIVDMLKRAPQVRQEYLTRQQAAQKAARGEPKSEEIQLRVVVTTPPKPK